MSDLKGVCVPVCTPFSSTGEKVDLKKFEAHLEKMIEAGVHIIAVNGGTGEFPFLMEEEKKVLAETAAKRIAGRAKLIIQTSAIRTEDAIERSKHAEQLGVDCLLILPPYFEGPGEGGVFWHYEQISRAVSVPIMVYNIPQFTAFDITPDVYMRLSAIESVKYIKDSTTNMLRIEQLVAQKASVFCGCDYLNLYALITGASGVFAGSGNAVARQLVQLYDLYKSGQFLRAEKLWKNLQPLNTLLWTAPFNPVAKAASNLSGNDVGECRRPVEPLSAEIFARVKSSIDVAVSPI